MYVKFYAKKKLKYDNDACLLAQKISNNITSKKKGQKRRKRKTAKDDIKRKIKPEKDKKKLF